MRLPRDWSGDELVKRLSRFDYVATRQTGSHLRLVRRSGEGEHHITIPRHSALRIGTLNNILKDVAEHLGITRDELLERLQH
jgi:predicted RNA binding protein YcfA (HicA-like mRNA interferase family)